MAGDGKKRHPILIIIAVLAVLGMIGNHGGKNSKKSSSDGNSKSTVTSIMRATVKPTAKPATKSANMSTEKPVDNSIGSTTQASTNQTTQRPTVKPTETPKESWLQVYSEKGIEVIAVPADVLYEYGSAYTGAVVVTSITVKDKSYSGDTLKANTSNNDTYSFSIVAEFDNKAETTRVNEGTSVIVIGTVKEMSSFDFLGSGKTVTLKGCHIVSSGITASEIKNTRDEQIRFAQERIQQAETAAAKAVQDEIDSYIQSCETVNCSDVELNPNTFKGKNIRVSGKVIQVSEGWFKGVTLRVDQGGSNIWYITYTRADENEPRILEGDKLVFYGECTGIESYTTILGGKVTIPAMKAKYYK